MDDDGLFLRTLVGRLNDAGLDVTRAVGIDEARTLLRTQKDRSYSLVILDLLVPESPTRFSIAEMPGLEFAREVRREYPDVRLLELSMLSSGEAVDWFRTFGNGYFCKLDLLSSWRSFVRQVRTLAGGGALLPKIFIVHGHDEVHLLQLKDFLQNTLNLGEPVVLRETPAIGRTVIERFEDHAEDIDVAFVILSPDDFVMQSMTTDATRQARPNVLLEAGYFLSSLRRRSGRVILLRIGDVSIPSDLSGITYIDVPSDILSVGEKIRLELRDWSGT